MTEIKSPRRSYQIFMTEKQIQKCKDHISNLSLSQLQTYIDENFKKATFNSLKPNNAECWRQGRLFRDRAKMAIIEKENRLYS